MAQTTGAALQCCSDYLIGPVQRERATHHRREPKLNSDPSVRLTIRLTRAARSHDTSGAREHGACVSGPHASGAAECYTARRTWPPHRRHHRRYLRRSRHPRPRAPLNPASHSCARDREAPPIAERPDDVFGRAPNHAPSVLKSPPSIAAAPRRSPASRFLPSFEATPSARLTPARESPRTQPKRRKSTRRRYNDSAHPRRAESRYTRSAGTRARASGPVRRVQPNVIPPVERGLLADAIGRRRLRRSASPKAAHATQCCESLFRPQPRKRRNAERLDDVFRRAPNQIPSVLKSPPSLAAARANHRRRVLLHLRRSLERALHPGARVTTDPTKREETERRHRYNYLWSRPVTPVASIHDGPAGVLCPACRCGRGF